VRSPSRLADVDDERAYGGKAHFLGMLTRADIRVPDGIALPAGWVQRVVDGEAAALTELASISAGLRWPVSVRSSAVGEDSREASHAGQFLTKLNVCSPDELLAAIGEVHGSAAAADEYRQRSELHEAVAMGIVVQRMVLPRVAGVMFTCDPVTGDEGVVIEGSWGLGEAVVSSLVVPDMFRLGPEGALVECRLGEKTVMLIAAPSGGGTVEREVEAQLAAIPCLSDAEIAELYALALRCRKLLGGHADVEWAIDDDGLFALQCRPATAIG
jgi:pyruvate,water dikinase